MRTPKVPGRAVVPALPIVALVVVLYALGPLLNGQFFLTFLVDVGIFGLVALGLQHLLGDAGVLNIAQAAFFGLGAYGGVWSLQHWHVSTIPALLFGAVVAVGGMIVMTPLLRLRGVYFAMASFAFGIALAEAFGLAVSITGGDNGLYLIPSPKIAGHSFNSNEQTWWLVLTVVILCYGVFAWLSRTGYGLSLHAVRQSETGARAAGINVARMHFTAAVLSVIPAAFAGVLYAQIHGIVQAPIFGFDQSVTLLTMVVIGGVLSRWGAFVGAFFALYMQTYATSLQSYQLLIYGGLIVLLMIFLPQGAAELLARLLRLVRRTSGRKETNGRSLA
jgi:branched-chain amino acid transport system permease protein